jgi:hypothetical protein
MGFRNIFDFYQLAVRDRDVNEDTQSVIGMQHKSRFLLP